MRVEKKDKKLTIELECFDEPRLSGAKKTLVIASSGGFQPTLINVNGHPVSVSVNATIPNTEQPKQETENKGETDNKQEESTK